MKKYLSKACQCIMPKLRKCPQKAETEVFYKYKKTIPGCRDCLIKEHYEFTVFYGMTVYV